MARSVRLRPWQQAALERLHASDGADFLAVATPGAGKTTFALTAARQQLAALPGRRLVVVAPTSHLKQQWANAARAFDLHLDPAWSASDGRLPPDMHGIVTTYQQVATSAEALRGLSTGAFVVLDEVHHAGDDRAWGQSVLHAFEGAHLRLSLSGTPFRSDTRAIPFVRYVMEEAVPDYEYGYGDALTDGRVVRPVYFPRLGGHMEWQDAGGSLHEATFEDDLDQTRAAQRLRTALSLEGEWLPAVLRAAHAQLQLVRQTQPNAGGLVIATDQDHARGIADILADRFRSKAEVVTSDDPRASLRIARFAGSSDPWIVAVRMVSEGVDIPRLRVGVFATTTTTELFFRQAVGRLVRWTPGMRRQKAWFYIPDDARLRARAFQIADQRRHSLRKREQAREELSAEDMIKREEKEDQLSLFAVISATPMGEDELGDREPDEDDEGAIDGDDVTIDDEDLADASHELELPPLPVPGGGRQTWSEGGGDGGGTTVLTRREEKKLLRDRNADRAKELSRRTGWNHAQVNRELNRLAGIDRITEATLAQLETRLKHADRWLSRI